MRKAPARPMCDAPCMPCGMIFAFFLPGAFIPDVMELELTLPAAPPIVGSALFERLAMSSSRGSCDAAFESLPSWLCIEELSDGCAAIF